MQAKNLKLYNSDSYSLKLQEHDISYYQEYLDFIAKYARPGIRILDAGCGLGQSTELLRKRGYAVTGLDGTEKFISYAKDKFPEAEVIKGELEEMPFPNGSFDVVAMLNVLEHVGDVPKVMQEALRVLKVGGFLIIHSPNLMSVKHILDAYRLRDGQTFEGKKGPAELLKLSLRNVYWLIGRNIAHRPKFIYREPAENYDFPDTDATVYLNPVDLKFALVSLGAKIVSYQTVKHLPKRSIAKTLGSKFFGDHMSIIRIAAKKGARYERH